MGLQLSQAQDAGTSGFDDGFDGAASPIDLAHLKRYTLSDRDLEHELLGLFLGQTAVCRDLLHSARSLNAWREAAHTLKGSAKGVGAWRVAAVAERAERLDDGPHDLQMSVVMAELQEALVEVQAFIGHYRKSA